MAEEMVANAKSFQRASVHVRRKHCARHIRYKLLIGGCIAVALLIALSPFLPRHSSLVTEADECLRVPFESAARDLRPARPEMERKPARQAYAYARALAENTKAARADRCTKTGHSDTKRSDPVRGSRV